MFFKHMIALRLPNGWPISAEALTEQLGRLVFRPCEATEVMTSGWVPPCEGGALVHVVGGQLLLSLAVEEKLLPAKVLKKAVLERARKIEAEEGRKVGRKEMKELKEQVTTDLLPRAFVSEKRTAVWIDPVGGWLVVDASAPGKADDVLSVLRMCLDPCPKVVVIKSVMSPCAAMGVWLASNEAPVDFTIDDECELTQTAESKASVRYLRHSLDGEGVRQHLAEGKVPKSLALTYADRVSFVLTDTLAIKKIKLLDVVTEENAGQGEGADERFDLDFALMSGEYAKLLAAVVGALGGVVVEEGVEGDVTVG